MKFSFITCTYNRSKLLSKNIQSVINNKFENFEHYIVDDGSTDDTLQILKKYDHIKLIKLNKNYGQPGAMYHSRVLHKVNGDYIIVLDSDDTLLPNIKKKIISIITQNKNIWSYSFNIMSEKKKKLEFKKKIIKSKCLYYDNHPKFNSGKGYLDFLEIRKKIFYKKFLKYFKSPKYWYSSTIDVHFSYNFNELITDTKIAKYSFGENNVTKGHNLYKYAPITLHTKKYLFEKFRNNMQKKYYNYHLKSLLMNQLIFPGYKQVTLKLLNKEKKNFLKKRDYFFILFLLLIPHRLLFFIKKIIKKNRQYR
jgi:glycosyltransferase involved in cell wall biosynthesis